MAASLLTVLKCCAFQSACDAYNGSLNSSRISPVIYLPSSMTFLPHGNFFRCTNSKTTKNKTVFIRAVVGDEQPNEDENEDPGQSSTNKNSDDKKDDKFRKHLERIVGKDDSGFSGMELATLIRNKYGRSYDVQLIKKEFMGRNLLALNVMWKYREQRSFPLTEEEYLLRLDDVANNLRCWGAVSHIRSSLAKVKERPRIGKVPHEGQTY